MRASGRTILLMAVFAVAGCGGQTPPPVTVAAAPASVVITGPLAGPLGAGLDQTDREAAFTAQTDALALGTRQSWRGQKGMFGSVDPGVETARPEGACRDYTHAIYVAGRARKGQGRACKSADGTWRVVT